MDNTEKDTENRHKKLAYIIGTYPEITTTFIDREIKGIRERGFDVQVLSIRQPDRSVFQEEKYRQMKDEIIYLLPVRWGALIASHAIFATTQPKRFFGLLFYLISRPHPSQRARGMTFLHFMEGVLAAYYLRNLNISHIHAHFIDRAATVTLSVSKLLSIPYSLTAHADEIFEKPVMIGEKMDHAQFTITVSNFNKNHLLKQYAAEAEKIHILHPWIELSSFSPPPPSPHTPPFQILSVGRLVENKGHQYLIQACRKLHQEGLDFECRIIGEGPMRSELESLIMEGGLEGKVHLLGRQPQSSVREHLTEADLFVLASVVAKSGKRDGMPVSLAEAMAMELPVISTDIVGIGEMVREGAGYLAAPRDADSLAESIKSVYNLDPSQRREMGQKGRGIIADDFSLQKGLNILADLFDRSVEGG